FFTSRPTTYIYTRLAKLFPYTTLYRSARESTPGPPSGVPGLPRRVEAEAQPQVVVAYETGLVRPAATRTA
ncbi:hypothetical protein, partial [Kitasatospora sp. NPDC002522]